MNLKDDEEFRIEEGILNALLMIPEYKQGTRSMEMILEGFKKRRPGEKINPAMLPAREIMEIHVDYEEFVEIMNGA